MACGDGWLEVYGTIMAWGVLSLEFLVVFCCNDVRVSKET